MAKFLLFGLLAIVITVIYLPAICLGSVSPQSEKLKWGGTLESFGAVYLQKKDQAENAYLEGRFRPYFTYTPDEKWLFHLVGDGRPDSAGYAQGSINNIAERTGRRWYINVREAYAEFNYQWFRTRIGKQVFDWSVTDTVSPTDNLCARDWTDIIRNERVGAPAVAVRLGYKAYLEAVFLPLFTPSKLPVKGGRWERDLPPGFINGDQEILSPSHSQAGLRAGTTVAGFDLGASLYRGYSYSPAVRVQPISRFSAQLIPAYKPEWVYSLFLARELYSLNLRAEMGYFQQIDQDNFVQGVIGLDKEWSGIIRPVDSFFILLQYANDIVTKHNNTINYVNYDLRRVLDNAIMIKSHYIFDSEKRWTVKIEGSFKLNKNDSYLEPAIVWRYKRAEVEGGVDILMGQKNTFFGGYKENKRIYLKMTVKY
jgi:hypothetical protein